MSHSSQPLTWQQKQSAVQLRHRSAYAHQDSAGAWSVYILDDKGVASRLSSAGFESEQAVWEDAYLRMPPLTWQECREAVIAKEPLAYYNKLARTVFSYDEDSDIVHLSENCIAEPAAWASAYARLFPPAAVSIPSVDAKDDMKLPPLDPLPQDVERAKQESEKSLAVTLEMVLRSYWYQRERELEIVLIDLHYEKERSERKEQCFQDQRGKLRRISELLKCGGNEGSILAAISELQAFERKLNPEYQGGTDAPAGRSVEGVCDNSGVDVSGVVAESQEVAERGAGPSERVRFYDEVAVVANARWDKNADLLDGMGRVECALSGFQAGSRWQARASLDTRGETQDGAAQIQAERLRQMTEEGWTPDHDDLHVHGELAKRAAALAVAHTDATVLDDGREVVPWKRHYAPRSLVIAGALIAAEIDRVQRIAPAAPTPEPAKPSAAPDRDWVAELTEILKEGCESGQIVMTWNGQRLPLNKVSDALPSFDPEKVRRLEPIQYDEMCGTMVHASDYDMLAALLAEAQRGYDALVKDPTTAEAMAITGSRMFDDSRDAWIALCKFQTKRLAALKGK